MAKSRILSLATALSVLLGITSAAYSQSYNVKLEYETQPTGPNQTFYVKLILVEHDIDVSAYQLWVGFNSARGDLTAIEDNTGQSTSAQGVFRLGTSQIPLSGVPYADKVRGAGMDSIAPGLLPPVNPLDDFNLGRLKFVTSSTYNPGSGPFGIYLNRDGEEGGGIYDGMIDLVPNVNYISLPPTSGVADWTIY